MIHTHKYKIKNMFKNVFDLKKLNHKIFLKKYYSSKNKIFRKIMQFESLT